MNMHQRLDVTQDDAAEVRTGRRRKWIIVAVVIVVVAIAALVVLRGQSEDAAPAAGEADAESTAPRVTVIVPQNEDVAGNVRVTGSIAATRDSPVGVQGSGGKVVSVTVKEGDYVRKGQVLARIDSSVQVQQVAQLRGSVEQARADLKLAESNLERAQALTERGFISTADIEQRQATRDSAAARVTVATAQLRASEAQLSQLSVTAPEAGLILTRAVEAGQVVGPGSGALFRIAQGGRMELRAVIAEQDLARIDTGMGAAISVVGSDDVHRGTVTMVDPIIDPQSRQGQARIAVAAADGIRPGAFATATIETGSTSRPVLPESAVLGDVGDSYVYVVKADQTVVRQTVTVGSVSNRGVVIESGLQGGERVVESAGAFLNEGDKIEPVRRKNPA